jgi:hypothetical protein
MESKPWFYEEDLISPRMVKKAPVTMKPIFYSLKRG